MLSAILAEVCAHFKLSREELIEKLFHYRGPGFTSPAPLLRAYFAIENSLAVKRQAFLATHYLKLSLLYSLLPRNYV